MRINDVVMSTQLVNIGVNKENNRNTKTKFLSLKYIFLICHLRSHPT